MLELGLIDGDTDLDEDLLADFDKLGLEDADLLVLLLTDGLTDFDGLELGENDLLALLDTL